MSETLVSNWANFKPLKSIIAWIAYISAQLNCVIINLWFLLVTSSRLRYFETGVMFQALLNSLLFVALCCVSIGQSEILNHQCSKGYRCMTVLLIDFRELGSTFLMFLAFDQKLHPATRPHWISITACNITLQQILFSRWMNIPFCYLPVLYPWYWFKVFRHSRRVCLSLTAMSKYMVSTYVTMGSCLQLLPFEV